jgi:GNAT superfamily N-acetyltransferase
MSVTVRAACGDDLPQILALYEQLAEGRPTAAPTHEAAADVYESICSQAGRELLVAVVDGALRGTADVLVVPNLTHDGKPWMIVENVVVDSSARRLGIGQVLMDDVLGRARRAGCYKIQLLSRKGRTDAHAFYEHQGFEGLAEGFRLYLD